MNNHLKYLFLIVIIYINCSSNINSIQCTRDADCSLPDNVCYLNSCVYNEQIFTQNFMKSYRKTVQADKDSTVISNFQFASENFGSNDTILVGKIDNNNWNIFFQYKMQDEFKNANITKAFLILTRVTDNQPYFTGKCLLRGYNLNNDWNEYNVTFEDHPQPYGEPVFERWLSHGDENFSFDITEAVINWTSAKVKNNGIIITMEKCYEGQGLFRFYSREVIDEKLRPKLDVFIDSGS